MIERVTLKVEGMTCANCVKHVERALAKLPSVHEVRVDLGAASASIAFDPQAIDVAAVVAAIGKAGYSARLPA